LTSSDGINLWWFPFFLFLFSSHYFISCTSACSSVENWWESNAIETPSTHCLRASKKRSCKKICAREFPSKLALRYRRRLLSNTRVYYEIGTRILQTMVPQAFGFRVTHGKKKRFCRRI